MGKIYECKICNYTTSDKSNHSRHTKSIRHKKKVSEISNLKNNEFQLYPKDIPIVSQMYPKNGKNDQNSTNKKVSKAIKSEYKCESCGSLFTKANNLSRHYKSCFERKRIELENSELKHKLEEKDREYRMKFEMLEDQLDLMKSDLIYYKNLIKDAGVGSGARVKITTNVQSLIVNKHDDAPAIEYVEPNILQFDSKDAHQNSLFLVNRYKDGTFTRFIGKCIVAACKKEDPDEQSIWSTDANRLTMFIKKMMADDDSKWISDKKGIQTTKYLIDPILKKIKEMLIKYNDHIFSQIKNMPQHEVDYYNDIMLNCRELVHFIEHEKLADEILRYMAPRLTYEIK